MILKINLLFCSGGDVGVAAAEHDHRPAAAKLAQACHGSDDPLIFTDDPLIISVGYPLSSVGYLLFKD